ncbi:MerR family transcriptional regulator [Conexibacter arvalis]|uniref:DNA-binding transcriptional MerR regulator n=1 Tax=Conexibacter arvalis TaxID=912552 RepID=A0A840IBJ5_9ACTN|nr:MerR family transcriptional regulator [Conexibacter arvalis]MBB4662206.1 DNA-binding transcriptional MerR regulator [Conexibacter arvalis]
MPSPAEHSAAAPADRSERMLQIGEVAERVALSLRTVRFYEEEGLVIPAARSEGGFRLYTEEQIERLLLIKQMKPLGFTVEQMRELLAAHDLLGDDAAPAAERAAARAAIADFAALAAARCDDLRAKLANGERFAAQLRALAGG